MPSYYVMIEEWLYPTESGREVLGDCDQQEELLAKANSMAEEELTNFSLACGDGLIGGRYIGNNGETGYMITPKNGQDEWYYAVRLIPIESLK